MADDRTCEGEMKDLSRYPAWFQLNYNLCHELIFPDIDECSLSTFDCIPEARCENTVGSYMCVCLSGYTGDGVVCEGKSTKEAWWCDVSV